MNVKWLVKNWFRVGHKISWKLDFEVLISLLYFHPFSRREWVYKVIEKKHAYVLNYLKSHYQNILGKYSMLKIENNPQPSEEHYIWVMWWQGEENAPELVKMCINSIRRNANDANVIIITEKNYKDYADIPDYIIEKHKKGIISFAQLSDIMRVFLIAKHGGLWLDSTIYVSQPIPSKCFDSYLFSLHTSYKKTAFVQNDRIHCFVLGGTKNSPIFQYIREFLSAYWKDHDVIIDYYLLDYSIMLAYWNISWVKNLIDDLEYTSEGLYDLVEILNRPYDQNIVNKILQENIFSKLVWNQKLKKMKDNKLTIYGFISEKSYQAPAEIIKF